MSIENPPREPESARERIAARRAAAAERVAALDRHLNSIREVSSWTGTDDEHDPEGATIAFERAQVRGLLDAAVQEREDLDRAESRLDAGTYGTCERCGSAIAAERLEALPAATTCIGCATRR